MLKMVHAMAISVASTECQKQIMSMGTLEKLEPMFVATIEVAGRDRFISNGLPLVTHCNSPI